MRRCTVFAVIGSPARRFAGRDGLQLPAGDVFLNIPQLGIQAIGLHQCLMRAFFLYPSAFQDDDPVGIPDGLEPVGNGNNGPPFDQGVDGLLHLQLIFGVERGGRFVQQDDRCVLEDGAGYGYALLFPTGQGAAPLPHHRVVALMYNTFLHRYLVIELKDTEFMPEYIGKLNFYCSAVDDILCREGDNRTIGLLLCKSKDRIKAEYALRDIQKPIGISDYELGQALPKDFRGSLPTIEEIEKELESHYHLHVL